MQRTIHVANKFTNNHHTILARFVSLVALIGGTQLTPALGGMRYGMSSFILCFRDVSK